MLVSFLVVDTNSILFYLYVSDGFSVLIYSVSYQLNLSQSREVNFLKMVRFDIGFY